MYLGSRGRTGAADPVVNSHLLYRLSYPATNEISQLKEGTTLVRLTVNV